MPPTATAYTLEIRVPGTVADVRPRLEAALKAQGFGVLTEIDIQATLRAKLGAEWPPHVILGACNPPLAHRALQADPSVGTLLPCNVVLRESDRDTLVEAMDPMAALGIVGTPAITEVAAEARQRLVRALAEVEAHA
jgi:uncharacterized protein (DUF302 family)